MKKILILGAGQSAPFLINYLLDEAQRNNWYVTVADRNLSLAQAAVNNHSHGNAVEFDVNDAEQRHSLIQKCDIIVNFLAPSFQYLIALDCLRYSKHVITASYENPQVAKLDADAKKCGVLILNEMGLDPGIDHMSAMEIITGIRERGGKIIKFISYGSGLPAPDVQSNPLQYCITWNPSNVATAGDAGAQYMENGKIKLVSHQKVFERTWNVYVDSIGTLEAYPNRDSLLYKKIFDLEKIDTMIRGTLRYPGWSETWNQIVKLGMFLNTITLPPIADYTYRDFTEMFTPLNTDGGSFEARLANTLNISPTGTIMQNLTWLGLVSKEKIGKNFTTPMELLTDLLIKKMPLPEGKRDMVILQHNIIADYGEDRPHERTISTLIDYGDPETGITAIAKTVGAPAAIAVKLVLKGELDLLGCHIPTHKDIYPKVLAELKSLGIEFNEKTTILT